MLPLSIKVEYIIRFKKTMYLMQWLCLNKHVALNVNLIFGR